MTEPAPRARPDRAPRILVTNDDGINAPGLRVLERIAHRLSNDVWVVAPETNQSGASHSLTIHRPLRIRKVARRRFAIDGTPTDCVLLALQTVIKNGPVDLVLSGVNQGSNLGEDVTYSGTIAAAMEATLFNVPAIALSQGCRNGHPVEWGPGRHGPGNNVFAYFVGPEQLPVEYTTEMQQCDASYVGKPVEQWTWPPGRLDHWGLTPAPSARFEQTQKLFFFSADGHRL